MTKRIPTIQTMNGKYDHILAKLPYTDPFRFVNQLSSVSEEGVTGTYTFSPDSFFYAGHFKGHPVTPGVILTECMAQIGLVCLGIHLLGISDGSTQDQLPKVAMSQSQTDYLLPVYPGEKVKVISEKIYFRFGKLKCKVKMLNDQGNLICKGVISGMLAVN